jgi:hypothetical protein
MSGWVRYLGLTAKAKTGYSPALLILLGLAAALGLATAVLLIGTIFIFCSEQFGPLRTGIGMMMTFLVLCLGCVFAAMRARRNTMEDAQAAIAARSTRAMFDTSVLSLGLEVGRAIGWRRLVPIVAVTLIAAGVAKEWSPRSAPKDDDEA